MAKAIRNAALHGGNMPEEWNHYTIAYHGTSIFSAIQILHNGFQVGPNASVDKKQRRKGKNFEIYCEGSVRKYSTRNYATHNLVSLCGK